MSFKSRLKLPDLYQYNEEEVQDFENDFHDKLMRIKSMTTFLFEDNKSFVISDNNSHLFECSSEDKMPDYRCAFDYVFDGEKYLKFISINKYPSNKDFSLLSLNQFGDYFITCSPIDDRVSEKRLSFGRNLSNTSVIKHNGLQDHQSREKLSVNDDLLEKITKKEIKLFNFEAWIIVSSKDILELDTKTSIIKKSLSDDGFSVNIESKYSMKYALSHLISKSSKLLYPHKVSSRFVLTQLPLCFEKIMDKGYSFYSRNNAEVFLDLFNKKNKNANFTVTGPTGSGKTFFSQKILFEQFKMGADLYILDRKETCKRLAEYCDIPVIEKFNPIVSTNHEFIWNLLLSIVPSDEKISKAETGRLYIFLESCSGLKSVQNLSDLMELIRPEFPIYEYYIADKMRYFSSDILQLEKGVYVDLDSFHESVVPTMLVVLLQSFFDLRNKRLLFADECHHHLKNNQSMLDRIYREIRSKNGGIGTVSQSIYDYESSDVGVLSFNQSYINFLFNENLERSFLVSDFDKSRINTQFLEKGEFSEVYVKSDSIKKTIRYYPSKFEYELFNTESEHFKDQKEFLTVLKSAGFSFQKAFNTWVHSTGEINV